MPFQFAGLTTQEVNHARARDGTNAVSSQPVESFWHKWAGHLQDPIILILLVALVATLGLSLAGHAEWYESAGIALAILVATLVATGSEYSNEHKFQQLLAESSLIRVKVYRDQHLTEIRIDDLVMGDQILLQSGDTVPTDGYLIAGHLQIDQAALTGESDAVHKLAAPSSQAVTAEHQVFRATLVIDGDAVMQTTAIGDATLYGQTMKALFSAEDRLSPLQQKLKTLGGQIAQFGYTGSVLIFIAYMINHVFIQSSGIAAYWATHHFAAILQQMITGIILAIGVIVMAVPEGLPMMIAMVLAMNMKKLLHDNVLVRKLLGIETAGSLTLLFSDKTGTLTQGQLQVECFIGLNAAGVEIYTHIHEIPVAQQQALAFAVRYNTSGVLEGKDLPSLKIIGADRTEQALLRYIYPVAVPAFIVANTVATEWPVIPVIDSIRFNSQRKFSATQIQSPGGEMITLVKGAAEKMIAQCQYYLDHTGQVQPLTPTHQAQLEQALQQLASRAMRLLAIAQTHCPLNVNTQDQLPEGLVLCGVMALRDALRPSALASVQQAQQAGIQVVMMTGDAQATAMAIAQDVGLLRQPDALVLTSQQLAALTDEEVIARLPQLAVVARALPTDKSRLVRLAKQANQVVGMTGDGVNDAPALKNADVSFAMGSGTEITKEASSITILDDHFASINKAVLYGRTLFKSIRKFLVFQLTVSFSAILVAFFAPFMGIDIPLTMTQLLWINMIMDTLAGLAFAGEAALPQYLQEPPIPRHAPLITADMAASIVVNGVVAALFSLIFLTWPPITQQFADHHRLLTAFFAFFVLMHLCNAFNVRTPAFNLLANIRANAWFLPIMALVVGIQVMMVTWGGEIMRTGGLSSQEWLAVLLLAPVLIPVDLARKGICNKIRL